MSRSHLPNLSCLIAFESVARHSSVSRAAEELHLTQGAISRQVSRLEADVNARLFNRVRQRLSLTTTGEAYLVLVRDVLDSVAKLSEFGASGRISRNVIRLAVQPSFARRFLLSRLPQFYSQNPNIIIDVECFLDYSRIKDSDYDVIIYFGRPDSRRPVHEILVHPGFTPVYSEQYGALFNLENGLSDKGITFLQSSTFPELWDIWFRTNALPMPYPFRRISFNDYGAAEEASIAGLGVALLPEFLTHDSCKAGLLKTVPGAGIHADLFYLLSYPVNGANKAGLALFRDWLMDEIRLVPSGPDAASRMDAGGARAQAATS